MFYVIVWIIICLLGYMSYKLWYESNKQQVNISLCIELLFLFILVYWAFIFFLLNN